MALKKEYRFVLRSGDLYDSLLEDVRYQIEQTGIEIVAICNQRVYTFICPLKELSKEAVNGDILVPITVDGVLYPEPALLLNFAKMGFYADLDLDSGEIFNENIGAYEDITYELEEKLNKAFHEQYKTFSVEAIGYAQNDWDVYGIVYRGERSEELENILKQLEKVMRTNSSYLSLEERTVDDTTNLHSDWEWVCDSSWEFDYEFDVEEAKKEIVNIYPALQDLDINSIDVVDKYSIFH